MVGLLWKCTERILKDTKPILGDQTAREGIGGK